MIVEITDGAYARSDEIIRMDYNEKKKILVLFMRDAEHSVYYDITPDRVRAIVAEINAWEA
uniref:Uncharacterized protein n=1 Tax=viral metagenome TaxID=1070528 RepID=A0A6M3LGX7_9ZZZZ